jgi:hypothetical protein
LLSPLIQLVKTGFTKAVQRLDGIYALLIVSKIAACDIKAEDTMVKEKLWTLISQNEPSLVQITLVIFSKVFFWYLFCGLLLSWQGTYFLFCGIFLRFLSYLCMSQLKGLKTFK